MAHTAHADTFARDHLPPRDQWPEFTLELPELRYPARMNCAAELLDRMVATGHGERPAIRALRFDGQPAAATYRQVLVRANQIAHVLKHDLRLPTGSRVLLRGANNPMMAACWFAVMKAGCIAVATMPLLRAKELKQIIDKAQVGAALCDAGLREEMELARAQCPVLGTPVAAPIHVANPTPAGARVITDAQTPAAVTDALRNQEIVVVGFVIPGQADDDAVSAAIAGIASPQQAIAGVLVMPRIVARSPYAPALVAL